MEIRKVGVVGAGVMGNGIAQAFAVAGYEVIMRDIKQEFVAKGLATIQKSLDRLATRDKISAEDKDAALARIHTTTSLDPFADRDLLVQAVLCNDASLNREGAGWKITGTVTAPAVRFPSTRGGANCHCSTARRPSRTNGAPNFFRIEAQP